MRELHNIKVYVYSINCVVFENDPHHLDLHVYNYLSWNVLQLLVLKISNSCFHVHKLHRSYDNPNFLTFSGLLVTAIIFKHLFHQNSQLKTESLT